MENATKPAATQENQSKLWTLTVQLFEAQAFKKSVETEVPAEMNARELIDAIAAAKETISGTKLEIKRLMTGKAK